MTVAQQEVEHVVTDDETTELRAEIESLRSQIEQLQTALTSRVAIEQAKGVLAERLHLTPDEAFEVLRRAARNTRQPLTRVAALVTASRTTPREVMHELNGHRAA